MFSELDQKMNNSIKIHRASGKSEFFREKLLMIDEISIQFRGCRMTEKDLLENLLERFVKMSGETPWEGKR